VFNDRELAALIWLGAAAMWLLSRRDMRPSIFRLVRAAVRPQIVGPIVAMAAYTAGMAALGSAVGIWGVGLIKATTVWFLGIGLGLLLNVERVARQDRFFRTSAMRAVRLAILIEFFVNLAVLPLPVELVLAPSLVLLALMSAVAEGRDELRPVKAVVDGLVGTAGLGLAAYVTVRLLTDWESFGRAETWQTLALPVWLTIGVLPFVYAVGVAAHYQLAWGWIDLAPGDRRARRSAKLALLTGIHVRARDLAEFNLFRAKEAVAADSSRAARAVVARVRAGREEERRFEAERSERLRRYAGVEGIDCDGQRLDQREFDETKEALGFIASAQEGWYTNPERRYRDDLLFVLEPFPGLPPDHGITVHVSRDGQAWWAGRRTVTGWCFAIGAAGPPPDEWVYDGAQFPSGFPGQDPAWVPRWGVGARNWGL
jgi:hypothetical protein